MMNNRTIRIFEQIISLPLWPLLGISTFVHWQMVKGSDDVKMLKRATYNEIKEKMLSTDWRYDANNPYSLFDKNDFSKNEIHASIFRFGDIGYLLTPFGLLMTNILQRKIRKTLPDYVPSGKPYITG